MKNFPRFGFILICGGLLSLATGHVFAGEYQKARDGKTMIWNWQPKPAETGDWSGGRDKDGYASGFGDLTWYNADGKVFGLFYGNMAHGKFEGAVNVHTGSRVAHAYFVSGDRVTSWARGSAKSNLTASEAAAVEQRKAEAEKVAAKKEKVERAEAVPSPEPKKEKPSAEKIAKAESAPSPAGKSTARGPDSYHKETAEKSTSTDIAEKKSEPLSSEEELKRTEPDMKRPFTEPTPLPKTKTETPGTKSIPLPTSQPSEPERAIKESPAPVIEESPPPLHQPLSEQTPEIAEQKSESKTGEDKSSSSAPSPNESPADISVNSLVGPPASLRSNPNTESSTSEKSAPKSAGPLTETEVVNMADIEARFQGAPLNNYDRPKVDHSQVKGKWTLFYGPKKNDDGKDMPPFTVTVEDKSRKVEVHK